MTNEHRAAAAASIAEAIHDLTKAIALRSDANKHGTAGTAALAQIVDTLAATLERLTAAEPEPDPGRRWDRRQRTGTIADRAPDPERSPVPAEIDPPVVVPRRRLHHLE